MSYINLRYLQNRQLLQGFDLLPLFYVLPQPLVMARKMDKFPRSPFVAATTPRWRELYQTIGWKAEVADIWALTIWPYLDIRGGISNYSTNDPFIRLVYSPPLWVELLAYAGVSLEALAMFPDDGEAPYKSEQDTDILCKDMAKLFWNHPGLKAKQIMEIVQAHRDFADFSDRKSNVRIDFFRKYYHTRAEIRTVPLDDSTQEEAEYIPTDDNDFDNVVANDWIEKFYSWLGSKRDIEICKLLYLGCTQQQIADRLGYKNHSGVNKRIAYIRELLEVFVEWQQDLERDCHVSPPVRRKSKTHLVSATSAPPEKEIRYDIIEFTYRRKIY